MANYIVVMDQNTHADNSSAQTSIENAGGSVLTTFDLSLTFEISATADQVANISGLKYSSPSDDSSGLSLQVLNTRHFNYVDNRSYSIEEAIEQNANASYDYYEDFTPKFTGAGKTCYLVDSGIDSTHIEFANASINNLFSTIPGDFDDYSGHGTSIGSLIVGENLGLAKDATLQNVKLFDNLSGNVTVGNVINALNSVLVHHNANNPNDVKVLCAPWVTTQNNIIDDKISEINNSNIVVVASAGNQGNDVNGYSPAGVEEIITTGAHDVHWEITEFTNTPWYGEVASTNVNNYGAAVDIFTLGVNVCAAESGVPTGYRDVTGTSATAGIVAGGVLGYIEKHPSENSNRIKEIIISEGSIRGKKKLSLSTEAEAAGLNFDAMNKSILQVDSGGTDSTGELFGFPSGVVLKVQRGQTANVDLQLNSSASNVAVLSFSPLSPWMTFDVSTGILTADTTSLDANMAPGFYLFGVRGKLNGITLVEEFSVGVYESSESELESGSSYYYDDDNSEYDLAQTVNYQLAPPILTPDFVPLIPNAK